MLNRFLALVNLNINSSKWYADFKEAKFTDIKKTGRRETVLLTKEPVLSLNCAKVPEGKEITDLKVQYRKEDKPRNCCVEYFHWRIYSNKIVKVQSVIQTLWILCLSQYYSRKQRRVDTNWCTSSLTGWFRNLKQSDCVFFFFGLFWHSTVTYLLPHSGGAEGGACRVMKRLAEGCLKQELQQIPEN